MDPKINVEVEFAEMPEDTDMRMVARMLRTLADRIDADGLECLHGTLNIVRGSAGIHATLSVAGMAM